MRGAGAGPLLGLDPQEQALDPVVDQQGAVGGLDDVVQGRQGPVGQGPRHGDGVPQEAGPAAVVGPGRGEPGLAGGLDEEPAAGHVHAVGDVARVLGLLTEAGEHLAAGAQEFGRRQRGLAPPEQRSGGDLRVVAVHVRARRERLGDTTAARHRPRGAALRRAPSAGGLLRLTRRLPRGPRSLTALSGPGADRRRTGPAPPGPSPRPAARPPGDTARSRRRWRGRNPD